jgi:hypothetical protein
MRGPIAELAGLIQGAPGIADVIRDDMARCMHEILMAHGELAEELSYERLYSTGSNQIYPGLPGDRWVDDLGLIFVTDADRVPRLFGRFGFIEGSEVRPQQPVAVATPEVWDARSESLGRSFKEATGDE